MEGRLASRERRTLRLLHPHAREGQSAQHSRQPSRPLSPPPSSISQSDSVLQQLFSATNHVHRRDRPMPLRQGEVRC